MNLCHDKLLCDCDYGSVHKNKCIWFLVNNFYEAKFLGMCDEHPIVYN
jgi:hypothetical protein